uniref:Uncharacterized protein n=1 Tax=Rhizoctonia solani TaxID=456999 RepID=N0A5A2_9AGAM|nr:hypothetical protein RSOL_m01140 [Rhizoctonia solani]AGK45428.1 hypothetical protein RSOL_m01140 [Rhizoctonia solani]
MQAWPEVAAKAAVLWPPGRDPLRSHCRGLQSCRQLKLASWPYGRGRKPCFFSPKGEKVASTVYLSNLNNSISRPR